MAFLVKKRVIHLALNDHSIRYMELKQQNPPLPLKWGERFLPEGIIRNGRIVDRESLEIILKECVDTWRIKNRDIQFIVPDAFIVIRKVSIPSDIKEDELKGYIYLELGTSIHLPFDEPVFDAVVLKEDAEKKEILLFAAQEELVMEYVEVFTKVNLYPKVADISSLSLYRLYSKMDSLKQNNQLLMIQMDLESVNITIFEDQFPIFVHHLPLNFIREDWELKINRSQLGEWIFNGDMEKQLLEYEDIFREVNRLLDFYRYSIHQGKKEVTKILLNGDYPFLMNIQDELIRRYELSVEILSVDSLLTSFTRSFPRAFHLLLGLAIKEVK